MNTQTKIASVVGSVLAGALLAVTNVQAAPQASAQSIVNFRNFQIFRAGTATQLHAANDFTSLSATATIKVRAESLGTVHAPIDRSTSTGQNIANTASVGAITPANVAGQIAANGAGVVVPPPVRFQAANPFPMNGNFAASGANDFGAPILNFGVATQNHTEVNSASYASLRNVTGTAGTNANTGLTAEFRFQPNQGGPLDFRFDYGAYVATFLSSPDAVTAKGAYSISFSLRDAAGAGAIQLPLGLGTTDTFAIANQTSHTAPGNGLIRQCTSTTGLLGGVNVCDQIAAAAYPTALGLNSPSFDLTMKNAQFTTVDLIAGTTYVLTATINTDANVELKVPEPEISALLGTGLFLMVAARRVRRTKLS